MSKRFFNSLTGSRKHNQPKDDNIDPSQNGINSVSRSDKNAHSIAASDGTIASTALSDHRFTPLSPKGHSIPSVSTLFPAHGLPSRALRRVSSLVLPDIEFRESDSPRVKLRKHVLSDTKCYYPMFALPIDEVMKLESLPDHQTLLNEGKLVRVDADEKREVIFLLENNKILNYYF